MEKMIYCPDLVMVTDFSLLDEDKHQKVRIFLTNGNVTVLNIWLN